MLVGAPVRPTTAHPSEATMTQQPDQPTPSAPREIPAGWYPDPEGKPRSRYWDGESWTEQLGPQLSPPAQRVQSAPSLAAAFAPVALDAEGLPVSDRSRLAAALL